MRLLRTYAMSSSAVLRINHIKDRIQRDPPYQRKGEVWDRSKKQLLIDSILNDYDIPKLYFHALNSEQRQALGNQYDYAVIDGRQRLEAIWEFTNDEWGLDADFVFYANESIRAGGLRYSDLAKSYPDLKVFIDSFNLPIVLVETDDLDLIEDMFSRLNEAVPLNAAEKRNALGGPMAQAIREVADHRFFTHKLDISNRRYQHREIAARLLFIEYSRRVAGRISDTKKQYLDKMVERFRKTDDPALRSQIVDSCMDTIDGLQQIFADRDELLRTQASVVVYYLVQQVAAKNNQLAKMTRTSLTDFYAKLVANRQAAEEDIGVADFDLLEFERLSQQGTNDAASIKQRVQIMCRHLAIDLPELV